MFPRCQGGRSVDLKIRACWWGMTGVLRVPSLATSPQIIRLSPKPTKEFHRAITVPNSNSEDGGAEREKLDMNPSNTPARLQGTALPEPMKEVIYATETMRALGRGLARLNGSSGWRYKPIHLPHTHPPKESSRTSVRGGKLPVQTPLRTRKEWPTQNKSST